MEVKSDNAKEDVVKQTDNVKSADAEARGRSLHSDLIADAFDTQYGAPRMFDAIGLATKAFDLTTFQPSFTLTPTAHVISSVEVSSDVNDVERSSKMGMNYSMALRMAVGLNANVDNCLIVANNDMLNGVSHVVVNHNLNTDSETHGQQQTTWSAMYRDGAAEELRRSASNRQDGMGSKFYRDNVDATGFVFNIVNRLVLHNGAVRENCLEDRRILRDDEPSDVTTMLSWPLAMEYDHKRKQFKGVPATHRCNGMITPTTITTEALALMVEHDDPIARMIINRRPYRVRYDTYDDERHIGLHGQGVALGANGENDESCVMFIRRKPDGRVWLSTPATSLFAMPIKVPVVPPMLPSDNRVDYFVTAQTNMHNELSFLLGRTRMRGATLPSPINQLEVLDRQSFADGQQIRLHLTATPSRNEWSITKRDLAGAALSLLRGYGVRTPTYNRACLRVAELVGNVYMLGSHCGGVTAPSYIHTLPPIMTYGIQGLRTMNTFGIGDPRDIGMGTNFSCLPITLGMGVSLNSLMWGASLEGSSACIRVGPDDDLRAIVDSCDMSSLYALGKLDTFKDSYSSMGEDEWKPGFAAVSRMITHQDSKVHALAKEIAQHGSPAIKEHARLRTAIGIGCYDNVKSDMDMSISNHSREIRIDYDGVSAPIAWHRLPQQFKRQQETYEAIGEMIAVRAVEAGVAVNNFKGLIGDQASDVPSTDLGLRRMILPSEIGTCEQLLLLAMNEEANSMRSLTSDISAKRSRDEYASELAFAVTTPGFYDHLETYLGQSTMVAGPGRYVFSGSIPPVLSLGLAKMTEGYRLGPCDATPVASGIATAPDGLRLAALTGRLKYNYSCQFIFSLSDTVGSKCEVVKCSPQSSVQIGMSSDSNTNLRNYDPMSAVGVANKVSIVSSDKIRAIGHYHDLNEIRKDAELQKDTPAVAQEAHVFHVSYQRQAPRRGVTLQRRDMGVGGSRRFAEAMLTSKLQSKTAKATAPATHVVEKPKTQVIEKVKVIDGITTLVRERIAMGVPKNQLPLFRKCFTEILRGKATTQLPQRDAVASLSESMRDNEFASFDQLLVELKQMGDGNVDRYSHAGELAHDVIMSKKLTERELNTIVMSTQSGKAVNAARDVILRLREGHIVHDCGEILGAMYSWMHCLDPLIFRFGVNAFSEAAKLHVGRTGKEVYKYRFKNDSSTEVPMCVQMIVNVLNERADRTSQDIERIEFVLSKKTTIRQACKLPAFRGFERVVVALQVMNMPREVLNTCGAEIEAYLKAWSLSKDYELGHRFDGKEAMHHAYESGNRMEATDPSCLAYSGGSLVDCAVREIAGMHLLHAGSFWTPRVLVCTNVDEVYSDNDKIVGPYRREVLINPSGGYPMEDIQLVRLLYGVDEE